MNVPRRYAPVSPPVMFSYRELLFSYLSATLILFSMTAFIWFEIHQVPVLQNILNHVTYFLFT